MKIACVGYRDWALNIYDDLKKHKDHKFLIQSSEECYDEKDIYRFNPDLVLFYGWSKIINERILNDFTCLMLHPSDLPKFRGGSPLQNQIIRGIKKSKISIFKINSEVDAGDIVAKGELDLSGSIDSIFKQLHKVGYELTKNLLKNEITYHKQDDSKATYFPRRKPSESEITVEEILNESSEYLCNKIRMLQDPYPNAFLKTKDGKKILIKKIEISE